MIVLLAGAVIIAALAFSALPLCFGLLIRMLVQRLTKRP